MSQESYVDDVVSRSQRVETRIRELAGKLTARQLNWKPAPDRWSVAQCFHHVHTVSRLYLANIDPVYATARAADPHGPFRPGPLGSRFAASLGADAKRKLPAPATFAPSASEIPDTVVGDLIAQQSELRAMYERVRGLDLTRTKVASPVSRLIRFRLGDILMLLANHQERHLQQAERVTQEAGFPGKEGP